ncbi:MAG TPA: hypothetical protein VHK27_13770 [Gammaproteobacteria bacterium]|nr:hypothetical protein [Gammaproteobacteria bacterium]
MTTNLDLSGRAIGLLAAQLLDVEKTRVAINNRVQAAERDHSFTFEFNEFLKESYNSIIEQEESLIKELERQVKQHPMGPWQKSFKGVGAKQFARLLGAIGDPYWHIAEDRPRSVAELWSYCGMAPGQIRRRGAKLNWSPEAKMRIHLIAKSIVKVGDRRAYDHRREVTAERVHAAECVRCGPSGSPAQPGSPWNDGHKHADALRYQGKMVLKEMWREARKLHGVTD